MFTSIHTSADNKIVVTELTRKLALGPENVIARLALAYSLSKGKFLSLSEIRDSKGKEYSKNVLFGPHLPFYVALICQHYGLYKSDKDIPKYIKMHIDDGLEAINEEWEDSPNMEGLDFLLSKIEQGLSRIKFSYHH